MIKTEIQNITVRAVHMMGIDDLSFDDETHFRFTLVANGIHKPKKVVEALLTTGYKIKDKESFVETLKKFSTLAEGRLKT